jgi:hypothetical protein
MTITRIEVIRAHRSASHDLMRQSPLVVGWTRHAHRDPSTCPVCSAMHGSVHPKTETLYSHRQCRCTMVPRTASWEQLGFRGIPDRQPTIPTGAAPFARLSAGEQRAILGPTRYRLCRDGALDLRDLVRPTSAGGRRPAAGERERAAGRVMSGGRGRPGPHPPLECPVVPPDAGVCRVFPALLAVDVEPLSGSFRPLDGRPDKRGGLRPRNPRKGERGTGGRLEEEENDRPPPEVLVDVGEAQQTGPTIARS